MSNYAFGSSDLCRYAAREREDGLSHSPEGADIAKDSSEPVSIAVT